MGAISVDPHAKRLARVNAFLRLLRSIAGLVLSTVVLMYGTVLVIALVGQTGLADLLRLLTDPEKGAVARQVFLPALAGPFALAILYFWLAAIRKAMTGALLIFFIGLCAVVLLSLVDSGLKLPSVIRFATTSPDVAIVVALYLFGLAFVIMLWYALLIGSWAAWRTARDKLSAVAMAEPAGKAKSSFSYFLGVPEHVGLLSRRRGSATILFVLSTIVTGVGIVLFFNITLFPAQFAGLVFTANVTPEPLDVRVARIAKEVSATLPMLIVGPLALVLAGWVALWLENWARRTVRLTMEEALASDRRAPVVFLRSFLDDQVTLPRSWRPLSERILQPGKKPDGLDQLVLKEGFSAGPVVALGKPGDPYPPYGAARGYFAHETWQGALKQLCLDAHCIILCVDDSEAGGVWWELEHLANDELLGKTLFLIHPRFRDNAANQGFFNQIGQKAPRFASKLTTLGSINGQGIIGLSFSKDGSLQTYASKDFGDLAYLALVRWHLARVASQQIHPTAYIADGLDGDPPPPAP